MTTQQHLEWFLKLLDPPYAQGWKSYVWSRAKEIAKDPEHSNLPELLKKAMEKK